MDGRKLVVKTSPGDLVRPGDVKTIDDEGMPMHKNPFVKVSRAVFGAVSSAVWLRAPKSVDECSLELKGFAGFRASFTSSLTSNSPTTEQ